VLIGKTYTMSCSHHLPHHRGKCSNYHGHNYGVEIAILGKVFRENGESEDGMVMDYYVIDNIWKKIEAVLDHRNLNEILRFSLFGITTAENLACWIFGQVEAHLDAMFTKVKPYQHPVCAHIIVRETDKTFAQARQQDWEAFREWHLKRAQETGSIPDQAASSTHRDPPPSFIRQVMGVDPSQTPSNSQS
jgi:6-pyruvoyltetrahydropterin/6-carboxytetrahydropterin synthase